MSEYYGTWRTDCFTCPDCGWSGPGESCLTGDMFRELFEMNCPSCSRTIFVVTYPTVEESRDNWDKVGNDDRRMIESRDAFLQTAEEMCIQSAEDLPDIAGSRDLFFTWDLQDGMTVVLLGSRVIWREPAFYEGYKRFLEVVGFLVEKYGTRVKDLSPTLRSMNYLYGDVLSSPHLVDKRRWQLL